MNLFSSSVGTKSETQAALRGGCRKVGQLSAVQTRIELNRRYIARCNETRTKQEIKQKQNFKIKID